MSYQDEAIPQFTITKIRGVVEQVFGPRLFLETQPEQLPANVL